MRLEMSRVLLDLLAQLRFYKEFARAATHRLAEQRRTIDRQAAIIGVLRGRLRQEARAATTGAADREKLENQKLQRAA